MATVVNARDVQLQAYTPRVASVAMADNIVVDPGNVDGLGLVIEGTKMVFLEATSLIFQVPTVGSPTPASTTLTAKIHNLTNTPTLTVTSGTITPAPVLVGGTCTIPYANLITETATMRLSLTQDAVTYFDDITLGKLREGADGFTGLLTNESCSITADYLGNPISYFGAGGTFKVYQGLIDITTLCTFALAPSGNPHNLTYSIGGTTGIYSVTSGYPIGTDLTTLTFRATFGSTTIDKVFTIAKSKAGAPGADGDGSRGSRTFYVTLGGSTATFSDDLASTTASVDGGPILNDTVVQTNQSMGFTQTKFLSSLAPITWSLVNAVVDGNLLVSGTVGASKISVTSLTAIQANLGTAQISSTGYLRSEGSTSFAVGNGFWMGYETGAYKFRIGNLAGNYFQYDGTNVKMNGAIMSGSFTAYSWPGAGSVGFYLGSGGLLIGDYYGNKFFWVDHFGNVSAPGFSIQNGSAVFSGALSAASGNFRGEINVGSYNGYAWPPSGQYGAHLGPNGVLCGNANNGTYFQLTHLGNLYMPNFSVINGQVTASSANITGNFQSGRVSVGYNYQHFYDPNYGEMQVLSSTMNSLAIHTGDSGWIDPTWGFWAPLIQTNDTEMIFQAAPVELRRRARVGSNRFNIVAVGVVDHYFTLWRRVNGGAWIPCTSIAEPQAGFGTAALSFTWEEFLNAGWWIQFGVTAGNSDQSWGTYGMFQDQGQRALLHGYISVFGVNY